MNKEQLQELYITPLTTLIKDRERFIKLFTQLGSLFGTAVRVVLHLIVLLALLTNTWQ